MSTLHEKILQDMAEGTDADADNGRSPEDTMDIVIDPRRLSAVTTSATDRHIVKHKQSRLLSEKDKGYAWVILMANTFCVVIASLGLSVSGILLLELQKSFTGNKVQLNIAATTQFGLSQMIGVFTGLVVERFGCRRTIMMGGLISGASFLATSFAPDVTVFTVTYLVSALGASCMQMGGIVINAQYFEARKSLAFGLYATGYSISTFLWPPTATALFSHYGWRGSFFILAGLQLQGCVLGALMRPLKAPTIDAPQPHVSCWSRFKSQCKLFENKPCMFFLFAIMVTGVPYAFCPTYCPTIGVDLGAERTAAALLVSIHGICSGISRIINGFLGDQRWLRHHRLLMCVWSYTGSGLAKICSTTATSYVRAVLFAVADGFFGGSFSSIIFTVVTDMILPEHSTFASGVFSLGFGLSFLLGNIFAGWLYTLFGTLYEPAFILGSLQILSGFLTLCLYIHTKLASKKANHVNSGEIMSTHL